MPHVVVKLWPGKSEDQKAALTDAIVRSVTSVLSYGEDAVSVGLEEVPSEQWTARVVEPDILAKWGALAKAPGYVGEPDPSA